MKSEDVKIGMKVILTKAGHGKPDIEPIEEHFASRSPNGTILTVDAVNSQKTSGESWNDAVYRLSDGVGYYCWRFEPYFKEFKVGDRVKIVGPSITNVKDFIGTIGTVTSNTDMEDGRTYVKSDLVSDGILCSGHSWCYDNSSLELVKSELPKVESTPEKKEVSKMSLQEAYLEMQKASGINVGDKVKILRKAKDGEMGWQNIWSSGMDRVVGNVGEVTAVNGYGIRVGGDGDWWDYPFFVLEVVESKKPQLTFADLPKDVLIAARNSYLKKLDNGVGQYSIFLDWDASTCAICQHMKNAHGAKLGGVEGCESVCPMVKDRWCDGGKPETSKLFLQTKDQETGGKEWKKNVIEFANMINNEIAKRE